MYCGMCPDAYPTAGALSNTLSREAAMMPMILATLKQSSMQALANGPAGIMIDTAQQHEQRYSTETCLQQVFQHA